MKRYTLDALEVKRSALVITLLAAGVMLAFAYPLAILPVWVAVTIAVLVYMVGAYTDYSSTKWVVSRYGITAEENPLYRFVIHRFGLPLGGLAASVFSIGLLTLLYFLLFERGFPDNLLSAFLVLGPGHLGAGLGNWLVINAHRAREKERL